MPSRLTPDKIFTLYVLVDPRTYVAKYVGLCADLEKRLAVHLRTDDGTNDKRAWIKELAAEGLKPLPVQLGRYPGTIARQIERELIRHLSNGGHILNGHYARPYMTPVESEVSA